ncbi:MULTISPECIES: outer membrane protein assembly factor BamA [unclassified Mesorhizobium]|uniref:outer membrane protein assembly factor BamA n=1 Tax=unclassified Mesorhizobium TaxID=325217 RepID=UPI00112BB189|nr:MULTISPECIES: outer membrane protein assembly factor BamA [unclassified Mesorhizobium]MBZ9919456.1 outer membrane protein assembly factor BamA [Mesorhizobium sp. BR1-1-7]MBZ9953743.1 outer membrane protein assembly factor BamA [Mesorhizobium sp. BR1-1-15]MBZ9970453.1 outer membrane protein assembly factor BamA [Mesorhizobium sp. BR1-1-12]MCA0027400.1 outer membrane protein assembly factor BamA [Mesorhizobium sp. B263B1A]TPJ54068.1 outer membrane protein assembly factor BamA [Mesorhizobium s
MKAASKFLSAASAAALSAALVVPGALAVQFVATSAAEAAVVSRVEVSGNQRVDADTIRNYITIKPGKSFSSSDIDSAVKALFGTGLFSDVQINQVGSTLVVKVSEYQVVNQVLFQGNKKLKDNALAAAVQLKPRGTFSQAALDADVESVKAAYRRIGRDDAAVTTEVMQLGDNRVNVVFHVNEGDRTQIAAINFVGNSAYSSRRLSDVITTKRSSWVSFILRDDVYDDDKLRADQELLRRFYYNHGYADFQVVSAVGELDNATNKYTVTITVQEGERYTFGDISVESTIPEVDSKALESVVETHKGDVYNAKNVEDTIIALTEKVAGSGYAFAQVTPRGDRNFENHTISVVYTIDQGTKAYVERIEIRGNDRTRDYVIRREFDVSEGDAFNQVLIQRAKKRLEDLNYFDKVEVSTVPGSAPDQVVLVVDVVEKSTGEFSVGAGYSTGGDTAGPSVEGSITERNFLGRGQFIKVSAGGGKNSRDYSLSFTEPYFLGRRIAAGFDIYKRTREYDDYDSDTVGATVRFGLPITDSISTQLAYNISREKYEVDDGCDATDVDPSGTCDISRAVLDGIEQSPWIKSSVSLGLVYNTIDDMKNPHEGIYATSTVEVAGLGGDAKFVKVTGRGSVYQTLSEQFDLVGLISGGAGHVEGYGGDGDLRIFDHFQSTDRMIRGFAYGGIGPVDSDGAGDHLGGTTYFNASAEAQFPLPVVPESFGLRGAVFADAATLYGSKVANDLVDQSSVGMKWRASVGVGLMWASPFGPIRIDYAIPVKKEARDDVQEFNFGISTRF